MKAVRGGVATMNMLSVKSVAPGIDAIPERQGARRIVAAPAFIVSAVLLFIISTAATIYGCASMTSMEGMPMPGGWSMSMTWMRMPGQTWLGAAAVFLGMWIAMMVAMMLPSLLPILSCYRRAVEQSAMHWSRPTALLGAGYFFVWMLLGIIIFPLGIAVAALTMQYEALARAVPLVAGAVVALAGALQFGAWKAHHLACCRPVPLRAGKIAAHSPIVSSNSGAWHYGVRLGIHCCCCCANLTAILLVIGVMDLRVMAIVSLAITAE
ncbi:MAG TPA: DUF2182 domain-containing protein, partial [Spongiibacteraceae bacterium]|nr:DUF2182 domain-containing protein [Spongiibacteraceae bacterium]